MQRIAKMSSSSVRLSYRAHNFDYQQKLLTIHQLIMQGFQAYQNHLPTSVPQGIPDKLKELLNNSISVCDIHRNLINCDINLVAKRSQIIDVRSTTDCGFDNCFDFIFLDFRKSLSNTIGENERKRTI